MKNAEQIASDLASLVQGDVLIDIYNRIAFSTDASIYSIRPECVVAPKDESDVVAVVRYASQNNIPIAPRGAGSGLAGESLTAGIVIDFRRYMNRILDIRSNGTSAVCQPGVILDKLNAALAPHKKKIGPDPSSANRAVIGGCVANNATGAHFLQYGYIADHVRRVRAVLYDGSVVTLRNDMSLDEIENPTLQTIARQCSQLLSGNDKLITAAQPKTRRNRCGYTIQNIHHNGRLDLARLMAGSEGTLTVFTEIELATVDVPAVAGLVQLEFASFASMAKAVPIIVNSGASACELMDQRLMTMARNAFPQYADMLPPNCVATLLTEHVGDTTEDISRKLQTTIDAVAALSSQNTIILDTAGQAKLWKSRKDAVPLLNRDKGPRHPVAFIEDVSVEPALLDRYVAGMEDICRKYDIPMAFYGHAGDGELHIRPYLDLSTPGDIKRMRNIADEVFQLAWSLGGTISGEHADGLVRAPFIEQQYGKDYYQLLCDIKKIFDPAGIINPGKIVNLDPDIMQKNLRGIALDAAKDFKTELQFADQQYRYEIEQCNGCGVCLSSGTGSRMCPVFRATDEELATPRGKANLLRSWLSGKLDEKDGHKVESFRKVLSLCVNCRMCSLECPSGVDTSKLIVEARAKLARYSSFSITELALSNNRWMSILASTFAPLSNWIMALPPTRWLLEKTLGFDRKRAFPAFQHGSFVKKANQYLRSLGPVSVPVDKVVYFADSYARYNDHTLGLAAIKVLRQLNIEVVVPPQRPAPMPAYVYGDLARARSDMQYNLAQLEPYVQKGYKILCSEPSAAMFLKDELPLLIDSAAARTVAAGAAELMQYLNTLLRTKEGKLKTKNPDRPTNNAYHAPCHLKTFNGAKNTLELFARLGVSITDLNGGCCGLAGTSGMQKKNRDLCDAIGLPLRQTIKRSAPGCILTECAACKMQIEHLAGVPVIHPIVWLAQNLLDTTDTPR